MVFLSVTPFTGSAASILHSYFLVFTSRFVIGRGLVKERSIT